MNQIKNIIIILIMIIIIIVICILFMNKQVNSLDSVNKNENIEEDISSDFTKTFGLINDYSTFFSIEEMLDNYITNVRNANKTAIYNLLDKDYTTQQNITKENVLNKIKEHIEYNSNIRIRTVYAQESIENSEYYIYCMLEQENQGVDTYLALKTDKTNLTYSITPLNKQEFEKRISDTDSDIKIRRIEKNENNKTIFVNPTEDDTAKRYFEDLVENALYYPEYLYTLLNEDYKEICFPTLNDFKEYIEINKEELLSYDISNLKEDDEFETLEEYNQYLMNLKILKLKKYQITTENNNNIYTCIDSNGKQYIFYAEAPFKYSVFLDNYSIPNSQYVKEYNDSRDEQKVILNIKKFFMGINDKNYGYSYSVLSESFRNSKYPTKTDFVSYVKQNFFEENEIEYVSYEKENGVYIYKIKLTDTTGNSKEAKEFNIILKLNSGTGFEMSFGENE